MLRISLIGWGAAAILLASPAQSPAVTYWDNFNGGTQLAWGNQRGNWVAGGNVYFAQQPGNVPVTASLLPYDLADFTLDVDINNVTDGGLWARANSSATVGVMLILHNYDIYWHVITDPSAGPWTTYGWASRSGSNVHVTLAGSGNLLSAYLNGGINPVTTLDLTGINPGYDYSHGRVGLYSFSGQTFDNVELTVPQSAPIPEMSSGILLAQGIGFAAFYLFAGRLRNRA